MLATNTDARRLSQTLPAGSVDLAFIDANHYHPWPLLDVLHLSTVMARNSWLILHDINLPVIAPQFAAWGARYLFDAWPFEKTTGGDHRNIGAVQLPGDCSTLLPMAEALLTRTWEHAPTRWHVALPEPFAALHRTLDAQIDAATTVAG